MKVFLVAHVLFCWVYFFSREPRGMAYRGSNAVTKYHGHPSMNGLVDVSGVISPRTQWTYFTLLITNWFVGIPNLPGNQSQRINVWLGYICLQVA